MAKQTNNEIEKQLGFIDRISIAGILKVEANYKTQVINEDIRRKIKLSLPEIETNKIQFLDNGMVQMPEAADKLTKKYKFTDAEVTEIKERLKDLDDKNKLQPGHNNIYKLFVLQS